MAPQDRISRLAQQIGDRLQNISVRRGPNEAMGQPHALSVLNSSSRATGGRPTTRYAS